MAKARSKKEQQIKKLESINSRTNDIQNRLRRIEKLLKYNFDSTLAVVNDKTHRQKKEASVTSDEKKYYAVAKGRKVGVFETWDECKKHTDKYKGAVYKKFSTEEEAISFIEDNTKELTNMSQINKSRPYAFVDGSFDMARNTYGYGGFIVNGKEKYIVQGSGRDKELVSMHNVAGEILATTEIIKKAISLGLEELTIYYDYEGIHKWASGAWKRNKTGTIRYYEFIQDAKEVIKLEFIHTKGHTGIAGNEEADRLAKEAIMLRS